MRELTVSPGLRVQVHHVVIAVRRYVTDGRAGALVPVCGEQKRHGGALAQDSRALWGVLRGVRVRQGSVGV
jgi:hypothetical protein